MGIYSVNKGHTLQGPGTGANGFKSETDLNRKVGNRFIEMLKEKGHTVYDDTVDKSNNDLADICKKANSHKVDLFISLHLNAFSNQSANGVETYYYNGSNTGKSYATKVQNELVKNVGWYNRGVKTANFYVLRNTKAPAILVELGFCTNKNDMDKFDVETISKALFKAITGEEYKNKPSNPVNSNKLYKVQVGAFSNKSNAEKLKKELESKGYKPFIV